MATAYAAFTSLMHLIAHLHEHPRPPIRLDEKQVGSLSSKILFFQRFLEDHNNNVDRELEIRIAEAAYAAEDLIEAHIADRIRHQKNFYFGILDRVNKGLDLVEKEAMGKDRNEPSHGSNTQPRQDPSAAATSAALTSAMSVIGQINELPQPPFRYDTKLVDSLGSKVRFLQSFLKDHNTVDGELASRIADAARAAEDAVKTHLADRILVEKDLYGSLQGVIEGLGLIEEEAMEMNLTKQSQGNVNQPATRHLAPSSQSTYGENIEVGLEDAMIRIMDKLTSQHKSDRQIISITGMGGIGKTTLARKVYANPYIKNYFDFCARATLSKDYNIQGSLVELLHCLDRSESKKSLSGQSEHSLGERLYKHLFGRKYLIILDDVWDVEAWERLRSFFPSTNGSGIIITTRESSVASIGSHGFTMDLLDEGNSWDLFCKIVFENGCCPAELMHIGRKISNNCRGLPLSIVVIGGHLTKSPRTEEYWEYIAHNLSSVVNSEDDDRCLKILSLSYTHLPVHLKPCFLYIGIFREDKEIRVSRLIRLWVAEGFLKPIKGKSLEEAAADYLNDLIGRNLILASKTFLMGKIKRCKMHDLFRDLCLKEASQKKFLSVVKKADDLGVLNNERRIVVRPSSGGARHDRLDIDAALKSQECLRTFIFHEIPPSLKNKLLRVVTPANGRVLVSPTELKVINRLVNVRYFRCSMTFTNSRVPLWMILHWNLQYLIIKARVPVMAPLEIWSMPQLRHVSMGDLVLPRPPNESSNIIMKNLRSAQEIINFDFCKEVVRKIPNIKKLRVIYSEGFEGFNKRTPILKSIDRLQKLESFCCSVDRWPGDEVFRVRILRNVAFPNSLRKLKLSHVCWLDVTTKIGSLPLLEELELRNCLGRRWKLVEGQFGQLKMLRLYSCHSLRCLKADNSHFRCLKGMFLWEMGRLQWISSEIGDISTLKSIMVHCCPDSAVVSAKRIADEQLDLGNDELEVDAMVYAESSLSENLSTCNFRMSRFSYY